MYPVRNGRFDFHAVTASPNEGAATVGASMVCVRIASLSLLRWIEEDKLHPESAHL